MGTQHNMLQFVHVGLLFVHRGIEKIKYSVILSTYHGKQIKLLQQVSRSVNIWRSCRKGIILLRLFLSGGMK